MLYTLKRDTTFYPILSKLFNKYTRKKKKLIKEGEKLKTKKKRTAKELSTKWHQ